MNLITIFKNLVIKKFNKELLDEELDYCISEELSSSVVHTIVQNFRFKVDVKYKKTAIVGDLPDKKKYLSEYKPQIQEKIDEVHKSQIKEFENYCLQNDIDYFDTLGGVVKEKEIDFNKFLDEHIVFKYLG